MSHPSAVWLKRAGLVLDQSLKSAEEKCCFMDKCGPVQMVARCVGRKASAPICSHTTELQLGLTQCNNTHSPCESRKTESPGLMEGRKEAVNDAPNWCSDS